MSVKGSKIRRYAVNAQGCYLRSPSNIYSYWLREGNIWKLQCTSVLFCSWKSTVKLLIFSDRITAVNVSRIRNKSLNGDWTIDRWKWLTDTRGCPRVSVRAISHTESQRANDESINDHNNARRTARKGTALPLPIVCPQTLYGFCLTSFVSESSICSDLHKTYERLLISVETCTKL